ncbi:hypothetical protein EMIHUDRAFT_241484 [Emiliania huxleyi CCMP1516]|uniref:Uncharacterized protein n=2 Tax=Emiliania huxleyi TaxID=2903 RepID=A0A0D3J7Q2_EMIH1|nr:hypothetical protein EMIHUDRAFT_209114 [Emiliania huxleyi CCMP1516]XP_005773657.1 hypothetical protein EMIHUDRAFT_241484 [Emiliania huxleyi CCMP1516]EOD19537.1 hypothetical protein EMIHUDRAFT_209114 [Emiliania huxleyi CCMP1516]EOD21228.1 hypothetical protein EMIHUDRAFT_241484 [Emiliania huxleyi CCMP1516]|eukprot:XP_005771966.1 hypothetical protein EMIHUDRAFT_209114 [Emiliania huxleyi CCMP1516]
MDHEHGHAVDATRRQTCCLLPGSEHCQPLRRDTNVLVLARLSELRAISNSNLLLSLLSATFLGTQIVCLITVATPHRDHAETVLFHRIEFISAFSFALVTVLSVVCAPERQYASQILLKVLVFFSVGSTCVAALLVIVNLHRYETIAHEIEYTNELFLAGAESLVVCAILRVQDRAGGRLLAGAAVVSLCVAASQLVIYNHPAWGEKPAHVLEFSFNIVCACVTFWFCMDNMGVADRLKREIMLAPEGLTVVIDNFSRRGVHDHGEVGSYMPPISPPGRQVTL